MTGLEFKLDHRKLKLALLLILVLVFFRYFLAILVPFFAALVLAALIEPMVQFAQQRLRLPRPVASLVILAGTILVGGYFMFLLMSRVVDELVQFALSLPAYRRMLVDLAAETARRLEELTYTLPAPYTLNVEPTLEAFLVGMEGLTREAVGAIRGTISWFPGFVLILIVTVLATYFFSKDKDLIGVSLVQLAPRRWHEAVRRAKDSIIVDMIGFIRAQAILLGITTVLSAAGLFIIGSRYWLLLALSFGILDLIPVAGPGLILFPWTLIAFLSGQPGLGMALLALFVVIFVVRQVMQPMILGDSTGIHPLIMLMAIYGGIVVLGVKGMLIGPVIAIIAKSLWNAGLFSVREED